MVMQEQEHTKFLEGRSYSYGKEPSQGQIALKEKQKQRKRSREYQKAFKENMVTATDTDDFSSQTRKLDILSLQEGCLIYKGVHCKKFKNKYNPK